MLTHKDAEILIKNKIVFAIYDGFLKVYPDTFIKCQTTDHKTYIEANGCMYVWYMLIINAVLSFDFSPEYSQSKEEMINNDHSNVLRFYNDLLQSDFLYFIVKNVDITRITRC
jgi:hypothetical protein